MPKYQSEIRAMFLSAFATDHFLHDVNPDDAIAMVMAQLGLSYISISNDLDIGLGNGMSVDYQLQMVEVTIGVWLTA